MQLKWGPHAPSGTTDGHPKLHRLVNRGSRHPTGEGVGSARGDTRARVLTKPNCIVAACQGSLACALRKRRRAPNIRPDEYEPR